VDVCYRHPSRETGVSCSSCGRPICPECMTPTPVGMRCPECAGKRTRLQTATRAPRTVATSTDQPYLTYFLIVLNVLVFLGGLAGGASATGGGAFGSLVSQTYLSSDTVANGEWWRLLTAGFVHSGFFHLLFNMVALYFLGSLLEPAIGRLRFGLIYFVSLLAGSFAVILISPHTPTLGASAAIFGLMGAALVLARSRKLGMIERSLWLWLGLNVLITLTSPGISLAGHLGGLIGGAVAGLLMFEVGERLRAPQLVTLALVVILGAAAVVGSIALASTA
jgi:membrane associated rhomboid family serine protease